jgi:hypothetical protein
MDLKFLQGVIVMELDTVLRKPSELINEVSLSRIQKKQKITFINLLEIMKIFPYFYLNKYYQVDIKKIRDTPRVGSKKCHVILESC